MQLTENRNLNVFRNPAHQPWAYCLDDYTVTLLRVQKPIAIYRYCFCDHPKLGDVITRIFETISFSSQHTTKKFFTNYISEANPHLLMRQLVKPGTNLNLRLYEFVQPTKYQDRFELPKFVEVSQVTEDEDEIVINIPGFLSQESSGSEVEEPVPNAEE